MADQVCGKSVQTFSRISGYYRPVQNWNDGKAQEFKDRKEYDQQQAIDGEVLGGVKGSTPTNETPIQSADEGTMDVDLDGLVLFAAESCPNCKMTKEFMNKMGIDYKVIMAKENMELIKSLGLVSAPTLVKFENGTAKDIVASYPGIKRYIASLPIEGEVACEHCKF